MADYEEFWAHMVRQPENAPVGEKYRELIEGGTRETWELVE